MHIAIRATVSAFLFAGAAHAANRLGHGLFGHAAPPVRLVDRAAAPGCFNPQSSDEIRKCLSAGFKSNRQAGMGASAEDDEPEPGAPPSRAPDAARPPATDFPFEFRSGSAALSPGTMAKLRQIAHVLAEPAMADMRYRIEGHTDTVGPEDTNLTLSQQRAAAVADFLQNECHIDPHRLEAIGVGKKDLVVDTPDQTPSARNRVVRIIRLQA